jgi:putative transposase
VPAARHHEGQLLRLEGKFGGMEVSEAKRPRALEKENRQLKHRVAELLLDKRTLQAVVTKKW